MAAYKNHAYDIIWTKSYAELASRELWTFFLYWCSQTWLYLQNWRICSNSFLSWFGNLAKFSTSVDLTPKPIVYRLLLQQRKILLLWTMILILLIPLAIGNARKVVAKSFKSRLVANWSSALPAMAVDAMTTMALQIAGVAMELVRPEKATNLPVDMIPE